MKPDYTPIKPMKEVPNHLRKLQRKYLRYQQAELVYSLSHKKLMQLASEAGAIYTSNPVRCALDSCGLLSRALVGQICSKLRRAAGIGPLAVNARFGADTALCCGVGAFFCGPFCSVLLFALFLLLLGQLAALLIAESKGVTNNGSCPFSYIFPGLC